MHIDLYTGREQKVSARILSHLNPFPKGDMTMDLDLETFLIALYVTVDDFYQSHIRPQMPATGGPLAHMSDSEVLCLGLAAQWRSGVPWKSEHGVLRYVRKHLRHLFPTLLSQSAFNRRLRRLWGAFILLQDAVAEALATGQDFEVMDGFPIPVAHGARSFHPGWLAEIARIGKGGNDRYFYGVRLMMVMSQSGVATGWVLASGNVQERWVAELLFSTRAGRPQLQGPLAPQTHQPTVTPPSDWMAPVPSCGAASNKPVMTDSGFRGDDWLQHWATAYGVQVLPPPKQAARSARHWWSSRRQVVETTFSNLTESFGLKYPGAHTSWGLLTRVAAKVAAYNLGILMNRLLGRPDFAFATLIV
jgi:hypothetical protein